MRDPIFTYICDARMYLLYARARVGEGYGEEAGGARCCIASVAVVGDVRGSVQHELREPVQVSMVAC